MKYLMQWCGNACVSAASHVGVWMCSRETVMFCKIMCDCETPECIPAAHWRWQTNNLSFYCTYFNFRVLRMHLAPSIRAGGLLRWTSGDVGKEKRPKQMFTWNSKCRLHHSQASQQPKPVLRTCSLHWLNRSNKGWCSTLLLLHNWVMFAQLPEQKNSGTWLVLSEILSRWPGVAVTHPGTIWCWVKGRPISKSTADEIYLRCVRSQPQEATATFINVEQ